MNEVNQVVRFAVCDGLSEERSRRRRFAHYRARSQRSGYRTLKKLADSDEVFGTYNVYLRSGRKSTGEPMHLTFDLNAKYAGQDFTLVHQKADGTYEYFYATADAKGDLTFGPLYELSPFMLVKGTLSSDSISVPNTGDTAQSALLTGFVLISLLGLGAGVYIIRRKRI